MAKSRTSAAALGKAFEQSNSPIYLVGENGELRFANRACAQWLGMELAEMLGGKLIYTSQVLENELEDRLKGLAPPPIESTDLDSEKRNFSFWVSRPPLSGPSSVIYRRAWGISISNSDDEDTALLVVCENQDYEELPKASATEPDGHRLHHHLARIRQQNQLAYPLCQLAGISPFATRLRRQVSMATQVINDMLILGPAGSGKQHLARTIHSQSPLGKKGDLVPVQSSLANPEIFELLKQSLKKKMQQANAALKRVSREPPPRTPSVDGKGFAGDPAQPSSSPLESWLLLGVDQLSTESQLALKQILQELGTAVRLLATSESDLIPLARDQKFDWDLAVTISTVKLDLVPLSERLEDVPLLVQALLDRAGHRQPAVGFDATAMSLLSEFHWPGNLDQLSFVIEESCRRGTRGLVTANELPRKFHLWLQAQRVGAPQEIRIDLEDFLESIEKELLVRAMLQAGGNKTKGAQLLSISRAKLLRRLQHFQIQLTLEGELPEADGIPERDLEDDWQQRLSERPPEIERSTPDEGSTDDLPTSPVANDLGLAVSPEEDDSDLIGPDAFKEVDG